MPGGAHGHGFLRMAGVICVGWAGLHSPPRKSLPAQSGPFPPSKTRPRAAALHFRRGLFGRATLSRRTVQPGCTFAADCSARRAGGKPAHTSAYPLILRLTPRGGCFRFPVPAAVGTRNACCRHAKCLILCECYAIRLALEASCVGCEMIDTVLATEARAGSGGVLNRFLAAHGGSTSADERQELVQETLTRGWAGRGRFRGKSDATTYLIGIAKRVLREQQRRRLREPPRRPADVPPPASPPSPPAERAVDAADLCAAVRRVLAHLSRRERSAFEACCVEGSPVQGAARGARCTEKALRRRAERARDHLREALSACGRRCALASGQNGACPAASGKIACFKYSVIQHLESNA